MFQDRFSHVTTYQGTPHCTDTDAGTFKFRRDSRDTTTRHWLRLRSLKEVALIAAESP